MGLKTFSSPAMEEGKIAHQVIQKHCSGVIPLPILRNIPSFSIVEEKEWDERLKIKFDINEKYGFHGWVDGLEPSRKDFLEIKSSGTPWTLSRFANLAQWKCYALGLPDYKKIFLVNVPRTADLWNDSTIKIFNKDITDIDKQQAWDFINKGISILENISEEVEREMDIKDASNYKGRSRYCFYIGCTWCEGEKV